MNKPHILFVCGKNQWRSPTAEAIYRKDSRIKVRSAGVSGKSRHQISEKDLDWADLVLVMEQRYKSRIISNFRYYPNLPRIESLDIPDEFKYMDEELIELITEGTEFYIN